jgi:hypothetical protein
MIKKLCPLVAFGVGWGGVGWGGVGWGGGPSAFRGGPKADIKGVGAPPPTPPPPPPTPRNRFGFKSPSGIHKLIKHIAIKGERMYINIC